MKIADIKSIADVRINKDDLVIMRNEKTGEWFLITKLPPSLEHLRLFDNEIHEDFNFERYNIEDVDEITEKITIRTPLANISVHFNSLMIVEYF